MKKSDRNAQPLYQKLEFTETEQRNLSRFFTNLDKPVFSVPFLPPEVIGALCSRASRAKGDLREIFLNEFLTPFLESDDEYSKSLHALISFLEENPWDLIFSNPKGRDFYSKWLAQYGDDSIAQMGGTHLVYSDLSLVAIKHFERMRVGLAPIEKSTRYVDYSAKVNGKYRYYIDPKLETLGLEDLYVTTMDFLFDTYKSLIEQYLEVLKKQYPEESAMVLRTKAFDVVRGLLPTATLSQVAFFGNGQAYEYALSRSLTHTLSEVRWAANEGKIELEKVIPSFLRRVESEASKTYQKYLTTRSEKIDQVLPIIKWPQKNTSSRSGVKLLSYDRQGEDRVIAALIYAQVHEPYESILRRVKKLHDTQKREIIAAVLKDRDQRYFKIPRAFEEATMKFEVTANWGVWKDLQRHRMLTIYNERFSVHHGYDIPQELIEIGLDTQFKEAILKLEHLFSEIENKDPDLAQYAVAQAHRIRFVQSQNLRSLFWTTELRTIAQGHPDYRRIEQAKAKLIKKVYPIIGEYLLVDMNEYVFARRDTDKAIQKKTEELQTYYKQGTTK